MPNILLRIVSTENTPGEWENQITYYNGSFNSPSYLFNGSTTFNENPFELAVGDIIVDECAPPRIGDTSGTRQVTRYAGNGLVSYDNPEYNSSSCSAATCDLDGHTNQATAANPSTTTSTDGELRLAATSTRPPISYVLNGTSNTTGQNTGIFTGLRAGTYTATAEDAAGCTVRIGPLTLQPTGAGPSARYWLLYTYEPDVTDPEPNRYLQSGYIYDFPGRTPLFIGVPGLQNYEPPFSRPVTELVDSYYLPDNVTFRKVYHDGNGGLTFVDDVIPPVVGVGLRFVNIIKTDIDNTTTTTGMVLLEATNDGAGGTITYTRISTAEQNTTGAFTLLPLGSHSFRATDTSGQVVEETIEIEDRYRLRWVLQAVSAFADLEEVLIYERDYDGEAVAVCGDGEGEAITRSWAGQTDPAAELPELIGQRVTIVLRDKDPLQFEGLATGDDRRHRVDVRTGVNRTLEFRGYASPDLFRVAIHEGLPAISIEASCGLGTLRDTLFRNHVGQDITQSGRWPKLNTLLHALSRCDVNLPVYVGVQLRDVLMTPTDETLNTVVADRSAYGDMPVLSEVVEAILRPYKAVVWQARGAWWVASELDMALLEDAKWTHYDMAGQVQPQDLPDSGLGLDLWAVKYPGFLSQPRHLVWVSPGAEQATVAAAKVVQASVKFQLRENNLPGGELQDWTPFGILPIPGWSGGPVNRLAGSFAGEKAGTYIMRVYKEEVLTAAMQTFPDPDYSPILLKFKACAEGVAPPQGQPPLTTELRIVVLTDGVADTTELSFAIPNEGPEAKMKEYSTTLPANRTGTSVRLKLSTPNSTVPVDLAYLRLQILPALVEWPESDEVTIIRPDGVLKAPDVELVHADLPRLALEPGVYAPAQQMDVLAWRHALSLRTGQPTTSWARPGAIRRAPLLETAALDRLELRQTAQRTLTGSVLGYAGIGAMSFGQLVVSPDAPGRLLLVVSCEVQQVSGVARLTLRAIGAAPDSGLPLGSRITTAGLVRSLRSGVVRVRI